MAGSSALGLIKTVIAPLLVAATLYLLLSFVVLPVYRRYRADITRYSQYAPLTSTLHSTTSIFSDYIPEALRPRSIRERLSDLFIRLVLPSMWAARSRGRSQQDAPDRRGSVTSEDDGGLFDEESGERMVGFDVSPSRRDDARLGIRDSSETNAINAAVGRSMPDEVSSARRLSRELEAGFRDDSESEASDEEVTVGRRRLSMASNR